MDFLINFIITWFVGLLAPILIRYVFVKSALSSRAAIWVAVVNSVFLWILFTVLSILAGSSDPGYGFVWVLVYFVAKAILMSNGAYSETIVKHSSKFEQAEVVIDDHGKHIGELRNSLTHGQVTEMQCLFCGEDIEAIAMKCKHCQSLIDESANKPKKEETVYIDDGVYTGEVRDGVPNGCGKQIWKNGDIYQGVFQNNEFHGWGTYTWRDGERYEGEWKQSMKHGYGVMIYRNGSKHEGEWREDKFISPMLDK